MYQCLYGYYFLGLKEVDLAKAYGKPHSTVSYWVKNFEEDTVGRYKNVSDKLSAEQRRWLVNLYKTKSILRQHEAAKLFLEEFEVPIGVESIFTVLHQEGLTWKCLERRAIQLQLNDIVRFYNEITSKDWFLESLVFLDEVSFDDNGMLLSKDYAVQGENLRYRGEFGRKVSMSILCFLGVDGIVEAYPTDGSFDRKTFFKYCRQFALAYCKQYPGRYSIWLMDDGIIHLDPAIINYLRSLGLIPFFLPQFAPYFNPLEIIFGMMKEYMEIVKKENPDEELAWWVGMTVKKFTAKNCEKLFQKCGYLCMKRFDPSVGLNQKLEDFGYN